MSRAAKTDLVKWSCSFLLAAVALASTFAVGQAQERELPSLTKYRVVRLPANIVDAEYNTSGTARRPAIRAIHPLDELAAEGWELVTVVHADGANVKLQGGAEAHGGDFVAFLRKRESGSSSPGRR
jgi:hypothetical protein